LILSIVNIGTDAGGSVTDAGLRRKQNVFLEAFLRAGGPTNEINLVWPNLCIF
jgi:hypothetical protein